MRSKRGDPETSRSHHSLAHHPGPAEPKPNRDGPHFLENSSLLPMTAEQWEGDCLPLLGVLRLRAYVIGPYLPDDGLRQHALAFTCDAAASLLGEV